MFGRPGQLRRVLFELAQSHFARSADPSRAIEYTGSVEQGDFSLEIDLCFPTIRDAEMFQNSWDALTSFRLPGSEVMQTTPWKPDPAFVRVRQCQYEHSEESDPSVLGSNSVFSGHSSQVFNQEQALQPDYNFRYDKAHLIEKHVCRRTPSLERFMADNNNLLAMTPTIHRLFDANTRPFVPHFNVEFVAVLDDGSHIDGFGQLRHPVKIAVHAYDVAIWRHLELKKGWEPRDGNLDIREIVIYVEDPEIFKTCLTYSFEEKKIRFEGNPTREEVPAEHLPFDDDIFQPQEFQEGQIVFDGERPLKVLKYNEGIYLLQSTTSNQTEFCASNRLAALSSSRRVASFQLPST